MLSPCIYSPVITYLTGPQNFDWEIFKNIRAVDDSDVKGITQEQLVAQQVIEHSTAEENTKLKQERNVAAWASIVSLRILPTPSVRGFTDHKLAGCGSLLSDHFPHAPVRYKLRL